jgi:hypothetical protein
VRVRDELQGGLPFTPSQVRWAAERLVRRTAPVGWGRASLMDDKQTAADQKPWALDADGHEWWPVEVLP